VVLVWFVWMVCVYVLHVCFECVFCVYGLRLYFVGVFCVVVLVAYTSAASDKETQLPMQDTQETQVGLGRSPGGHGNLLQYSCLENSIDRGALWATVHRVAQVGHDSSD